ncbi:carboxylesterase/lipase family protein [Williamsia sterculiae]|uniref:Carboxylic ester hydrolase n=1 Tax=Williamsia sterculiae TaxID=1344003 RepID=A0A1N7CUM0_9NOCA|nr:carboxylesterase/lipase family protein [Williamsia sterculiae]SIR67175.1 para-nitrobenzyl esterase [Williamsia sterculiae]
MQSVQTRVKLSDGVIEGVRRGDLLTWRGIPYAAPPVGDLRFRAPQPVRPWTGIRAADDFRNAAPQRKQYTMVAPGRYQPTSEDCLTLNVVAPDTPSVAPRPVMVFIHGGAYILGSSATPLYWGHRLARRGVVYVSINYRLGALGYLDTTDHATEGRPLDSNLGLRDQVAALEWVRANIAAFGGDPDNVTVFGESAGGNAVTTLLATPAAAGLFHQAIAESSAPALTLARAQAKAFAYEYVELLLAETGGSDAGEALRTATVRQIGAASTALSENIGRRTPGIQPFGPVVDGDYLPIDPLTAAREGATLPVPLIIGTNRDEGTLFAKAWDILPTNEQRIERMFSVTDDAAKPDILATYDGYPSREACIDFSGDLVFWAQSMQFADGHSAVAPTYVYRFDYAPHAFAWTGFGATHGSELFAVFDVYRGAFGRLLTAGLDRRSSNRVVADVAGRWVRFARGAGAGPDWPAYRVPERAVRVFDRRSYVERDPHGDRREAWSKFVGYSEGSLPIGPRTEPA